MAESHPIPNFQQASVLGSKNPAVVADIPLAPPFDDYYLSTLTAADFPRLVQLYNDTDLSTILYSAPYPYTIEDAHWFNENKAHTSYPDFPGTHEAWVVRSRSNNGLLVGICGTHPHPENIAKNFSLGYFLAPEFRQKGIMPVVVAEVLKHFPGAKFQAEAEVGNMGSQKVLDKCGFQKVDGWVTELEWPESKGGGVRKLVRFTKDC
ncbi:hypothetical protein H072_10029 [Dactylellina haptotyla CBS 200.50]|uniref:N-acetyltransferase domain-containing protein n=1 Tax=Dactylellina haptotyla (strain CBS 200.50) TaxID=1284197 RepID=S8A180_DACHA|nr:hypothetical protein H072_10029 [Dactylellina haptotyla CBS 200.50]